MQFWTSTHAKTVLPALALMLAVALLLRLLLAGRDERVRILPFQIVATLLGMLEIVKQIISLSRGYDLWHLPLHLCSVITVLLPLMAFYRGRYKDGMRSVTVAFSAGLFALMMIAPNSIYSERAIKNFLGDFSDFHTTAFHLLAIFAFVLIVALDLHRPVLRRDCVVIVLAVLCYVAVAGTAANLLQVNFHNLYECLFQPVERLRLHLGATLGYARGQAVYVFLMAIANSVGILTSYTLYYLVSRLCKSAHK